MREGESEDYLLKIESLLLKLLPELAFFWNPPRMQAFKWSLVILVEVFIQN
jgi:hypothetical protein